MQPNIKINDKWITITANDLYHFGKYNKSVSGDFIVSWNSGNSKKEKGRCFLLKGNCIVLDHKLPRPMKAVVANNGTFFVNDCRFINWNEGITTATLYCFNIFGDCLFKIKPKSLLTSIAISSDGKFAAYSTAGGKNKDANKLFIINVYNGLIVYSCSPIALHPNDIIFNDTNNALSLIYNDHRNIADQIVTFGKLI